MMKCLFLAILVIFTFSPCVMAVEFDNWYHVEPVPSISFILPPDWAYSVMNSDPEAMGFAIGENIDHPPTMTRISVVPNPSGIKLNQPYLIEMLKAISEDAGDTISEVSNHDASANFVYVIGIDSEGNSIIRLSGANEKWVAFSKTTYSTNDKEVSTDNTKTVLVSFSSLLDSL